jgi:hypothetical protein
MDRYHRRQCVHMRPRMCVEQRDNCCLCTRPSPRGANFIFGKSNICCFLILLIHSIWLVCFQQLVPSLQAPIISTTSRLEKRVDATAQRLWGLFEGDQRLKVTDFCRYEHKSCVFQVVSLPSLSLPYLLTFIRILLS